MANVLTDLAADIYKSADMIGHEVTGAISSVIVNADGSERVAVGDTVRSHFTRQPASSSAISESMTIPEGTDQTVDNKTATISKSQSIQIPWTGEDVKSVNNGSGFSTIYGDQIVQAMRTLTNEIETDLCTAIYQGGSRATGVAGTTPFSSDFKVVAQARQILVDNGQKPTMDTSMVLNTLAGTNLRNLAQLQKANESGSTSLLRQGELLDLQGISLKESAQVQAHTQGTGAGYLASAAASIGDTSISLDTGTGTVLAGDVVTFTGDTNKYVVVTALTGGVIVIGGNGLREALADNTAMTIGATTTASNFAIKRGSAELIIRAPAMVEGGDAATDAMMVSDPHSGLVFEIRTYKGYRKSMLEVACAWGQKVWKNDGIALILG